MIRKNPYTRLLGEIKEFCFKVEFRHVKVMWNYPKNRLGEGWELSSLYQRTQAAEQLGYDVQLVANDEGLSVQYKKKTPSIPYGWK